MTRSLSVTLVVFAILVGSLTVTATPASAAPRGAAYCAAFRSFRMVGWCYPTLARPFTQPYPRGPRLPAGYR